MTKNFVVCNYFFTLRFQKAEKRLDSKWLQNSNFNQFLHYWANFLGFWRRKQLFAYLTSEPKVVELHMHQRWTHRFVWMFREFYCEKVLSKGCLSTVFFSFKTDKGKVMQVHWLFVITVCTYKTVKTLKFQCITLAVTVALQRCSGLLLSVCRFETFL